jgi:transcriptional regulator with XRE-family HTH domain
MIVGAQMRAARALLGLDQRDLARLAGLSLPTIQRMESSPGSVRAVVDSLERVMDAFTAGGVELIADGAPSTGSGFGVRLIQRSERRVTAHVA